MKKQLILLLITLLLLAACRNDNNQNNDQNDNSTPGNNQTNETNNVNDSQSDNSDQESQPITVRFAVFDFDFGQYTDLIDLFEEENPDIRIRLESMNEILELDDFGGGAWPEDADLRQASAADVLGTSFGGGEGLAYDLTPLIESDPAFDVTDFYPGTLEVYQSNGGIWAIPTTVDYQLIFFNKDMFDEAGLDYPEPGWSWPDFRAAANALTIRDGEETTQWGFVLPFPFHTPFILSQVGSVYDESTDPPTPLLDSADVAAAVQFYTGLYLVDEVMPYFPQPEINEDDPAAFSLPEGYQIIENGQAAMWYDSFASFAFRQSQFNLGMVPFPVNEPDARTTPFFVNSLAMSAGTQNPQAAWRWMVFLTEQQTDNFGFGPSSVPARRSISEASDLWAELDADVAATLRYAVDHGFGGNVNLGLGELDTAINAILEDGTSVADALAEAQTRAEETYESALTAGAEATPLPDIAVVGDDETENPAATTITFLVAGGSFGLQPYRSLVDAFEASHPDINVELTTPSFSGTDFSIATFATDADCFQTAPNLQDPDNLAAILSIEPFLDADPTFDTADFFPVLLDDMTYQGQLWGLPAEAAPGIIEYNKDLFDAAGLDYPANDWTLNEFLDMAIALTSGEGDTKVYGYVSDAFEISSLFTMFERFGVTMTNENESPPAAAFDAPEMVEAMRWYANLSLQYEVKPILITNFGMGTLDPGIFEEREALVNEGRAAMWATFGFVGFPGQGVNDLNVGVAPLPAGPNGVSGGYSQSSGYFISAQTQQRQACWEWIKFLTEYPDAVTGLPARRSVAESAAYQQLVGEEKAAAYIYSIENSEGVSAFTTFGANSEWLGISIVWFSQAYDEIMQNGVSVEDALAAAQEKADTYRACIIANEGYDDQEIQQDCAQEVDPSIPDLFFGG